MPRSYTAISRKVVAKKVHPTIPKGNMGYDQYTVPNDFNCRTYFFCFPTQKTYVHGLPCLSFKFLYRRVNSKPPTIPFGIVACTFSDNLSRNSCIWLLFVAVRPNLSFQELFSCLCRTPLASGFLKTKNCDGVMFWLVLAHL